MNKNYYILISIFLSLILLGCSNFEVLERYDNGAVKIKAQLNDGMLHGTYKSFYENGSLESLGTYAYGKRNGDFEYYYESGELEQKVFFQNNLIQGMMTEYYINGKVKGETMFVSDTVNGSVVKYFENGKVEFEGTFLNGEPTYFEKYDSVGTLIDWKMNLEISHEFNAEKILKVNFHLKNKKYDVIRIESQIYENDQLLTTIKRNSNGDTIESVFELPDDISKLSFLGKIWDIQLLPDSTQAVIKNVSSFEYEVNK